jgi:hypothetical protein
VASAAVTATAVGSSAAVTATDVSEAPHVQETSEVEAEAVQAEALVGVPEGGVVVGPRRIAECPCLAARHVEHAGCAQAAQLLQLGVLLAQQQDRAARLLSEGRCALGIRPDPVGEVLASELQPAAELGVGLAARVSQSKSAAPTSLRGRVITSSPRSTSAGPTWRSQYL